MKLISISNQLYHVITFDNTPADHYRRDASTQRWEVLRTTGWVEIGAGHLLFDLEQAFQDYVESI